MTRRWLPWITTVVVALGVAGSAPPVAAQEAAQEAPLQLGRTVTIDTPDLVESQDLVVSGQVVGLGAIAEEVVVSVELLPPLPEACDKDHRAVIPVHEQGYRVEFPLECNGPYRIQVAVRSGGTTWSPETKDVGVLEKPPAPASPMAAAGWVTWSGPTTLDAVGWVLMVDGDPQGLPLETTTVAVPKDGYTHTYAVRQVRWGVGGPGSEPILSDPSGEVASIVPYTPRPQLEPTTPVDPPPANTAPVPTTPPASSSTVPPTTADGSLPTRGTGAPSTALPEGYREELPYGTPDDAFVPGDEPARSSAVRDGEESAAGLRPSRGFVRTADESAPGLVAPFALGLMLVTVAAHIAWYLRRSRPGTNGQGLPH